MGTGGPARPAGGRRPSLADDPLAEEARLQEGLTQLGSRSTMLLSVSHGLSGASIEVLETYRMFADDRGWNRSLEEAVRGGLSAEAAVDRARTQHRARFAAGQGPLHPRAAARPRRPGQPAAAHPGRRGNHPRTLPDNAILVARNLGPADLLEYPRRCAQGPVAGRGLGRQPCGHLVARALEIPCVGRLSGLRDRSVGRRHRHRRRRDGRGAPAPPRPTS
jgi:phosphotransferase system enzyme I (PtsP)